MLNINKTKLPQNVNNTSYQASNGKDTTGITFPTSDKKVPLTEFKQKLWNEYISELIRKSLASTGLKEYNFAELKDDNTAILQSQKHLINLLKYYEGDRYHYYEAITIPYEDKFQTTTCGFGERTKEARTQESAYENLIKNIEEHAKYIKAYIGTEEYNNLPSSIKEGLIDLSYNKGPSAIKNNQALQQAIKTKDYAQIIKNMVYLTSGQKGASTNPDPGLYRRSLSRAILASRDLDKNEDIEKVIDQIYSEAKNCPGQALNDLEKIYSAYKKGDIKANPISSESAKYEVKKGDTLYSIARKHCPQGVSPNNLVKEIERINRGIEIIKPGYTLNIPLSIDGQRINFEENQEFQTQGFETEKKDIPVANKGVYIISEDIQDYQVGEEYAGMGYFAIARDIHRKYLTPDFSISDLSRKISDLNQDKTFAVGDTIKIPIIVDKNLYEKEKTKGTEVETDDLGISAPNQSTSLKSMMSDMEYSTAETNSALNILTFKYKVKKGNTIYSIAQKYGIDVKTLMDNNDITSASTIQIGQEIKINKIAYKVKQGDVLNKIADKYSLSTSYVQALNGIEDVNKIKIGEYIEIPGYIYTVKKGDNLTQIAQNAGINLNTLTSINNLKDSTITPQQKLLILYNDADYNVDKKNKAVSINENGAKVEIIKMGYKGIYEKRPHLIKTKVNGKVVATKKEFYDPNQKGALKGKTIIVNAGHGYHPDNIIDCGTKGLNGLDDEWLINYDNAMRLIERLKNNGAKVIYIQGYEGKASKGQDLVSQAIRNKDNKADLFISIHVNSSASTNQEDRMDIYYPRGSSISKDLAEKFEKGIESYTKNRNYANTKKAGFQVLNTAKSKNMPSILWEVAFMNSADGRNRLRDSRLMNKYSDLLCESVIDCLTISIKKDF